MGLTPRFTDATVREATLNGLQEIENGLFEVLKYVGETWVKNARNALNITGAFPKGDFTDRTGNLRSSIGYAIKKDGSVVYSNLTGENAEGVQAAKSTIAQLPAEQGYQLIGVAGMEYASYVEAKGYNVITSQADTAIIDLRKLLFKMQERYSRKGIGIDFNEITGSIGSALR